MQKENNRANVPGRKKGELEEENVDYEDETDKFINRLAIQRKLLNNFVDLTMNQAPQIVKKKKIRKKNLQSLIKTKL